MSEVTTNVKGIPGDVRAALIEDAEASDSSMVAVAVGILAEHFGVALNLTYERPRGPTRFVEGETQMVLRMPRELLAAIWGASRAWGMTQSAVVIRVLAAHYGLPFNPPRRGGRPRKAKA